MMARSPSFVHFVQGPANHIILDRCTMVCLSLVADCIVVILPVVSYIISLSLSGIAISRTTFINGCVKLYRCINMYAVNATML